MVEMTDEARNTRPAGKAGGGQLVSRNRGQPRQGDIEGLAVKESHTDQGQAEEQEVHGNAEHLRRVHGRKIDQTRSSAAVP